MTAHSDPADPLEPERVSAFAHALPGTEAWYRELIENLPVAVLVCEPTGVGDAGGGFVVTGLNAMAERLGGLKREEVRGRGVLEVLPGACASGLLEAMRRTHQSGAAERLPPMAFARDGATTWRDHWVCRMRDGRVVCVYQNVTEQKTAEADLRAVTRALHLLRECNQTVARAVDESDLYQGICRVLVGHGGYRMAWIGLLEHDAEKSVRPVASAGFEERYLETLQITWADTERGQGPTGTAARTGHPCTTRHILTDPRYSPWREQAIRRGYASSAALPFEVEGRTAGTLNLYSSCPDAFDDRELKLLEDLAGDIGFGVSMLRARALQESLSQQLIQSHKMEALGRLAGGVAHDFNNLLVVVFAYTRAVHDKLAADDPRRKDLAQILRAAERANQLTNQLLAFSRKKRVQPILLDLNQAILSVDKMLRRTLGETIELVVSLAENLPLVRIDSGQLDQILLNLAVNAFDAMPDGGTLTIETFVAGSEPAPKEVPPGYYVGFSVSDTGVGIPEELLPKIFDPFFTTKGSSGTGLGLSLCFGIVEQADGHIFVDSKPGRGATFTVWLPRAEGVPEPRAAEVESRPTPPLDGRGTLLVVEDNQAVLMAMQRILRGEGFDVLTARSAEEAVEVLSRMDCDPALVITDVILPGMSGYELARRITNEEPWVKLLLVSGYLGEDAPTADSDFGSLAFLPKPFSPSELLKRVHELLDPSAGRPDDGRRKNRLPTSPPRG